MVLSETEAEQFKLKKTLTAIDLIALGIGAIIGTGIFVITGVAAAEKAGLDFVSLKPKRLGNTGINKKWA
ncbi:hypothetical protein CDSM653_02359 [Caldanaerobacter subterraneus subsp. pacificus DSM 12653]|uniref:Amino acid permease n=1 Tax=Caldanaerobacter subterraneus subsp. pacificus DSM 12653 TaxID=391606 RepID=A0A0F5PIW7_9THEO|nr:hypothetical protein CDSM653_02359 [Caldanaerobacter subterraneus subsp. pacificus DSM 12653]